MATRKQFATIMTEVTGLISLSNIQGYKNVTKQAGVRVGSRYSLSPFRFSPALINHTVSQCGPKVSRMSWHGLFSSVISRHFSSSKVALRSQRP